MKRCSVMWRTADCHSRRWERAPPLGGVWLMVYNSSLSLKQRTSDSSIVVGGGLGAGGRSRHIERQLVWLPPRPPPPPWQGDQRSVGVGRRQGSPHASVGTGYTLAARQAFANRIPFGFQVSWAGRRAGKEGWLSGIEATGPQVLTGSFHGAYTQRPQTPGRLWDCGEGETPKEGSLEPPILPSESHPVSLVSLLFFLSSLPSFRRKASSSF
uniref:Uncharacterized protein n=1 Tax=Micrurus carvalhoi TaxID=3147026 RepID=A0A2H6NDL3_9SAUR